MQLITITVYMGLVLGITLMLYGRFKATEMYTGYVLGMSLSTGLTVGSLTVLISTFCRHGIATGIISSLIVGAHYVWIPTLGPIALFFNPFPESLGLFQNAQLNVGSIIGNRIFAGILLIFIFDYLVRRLRRTARWFT